MLKKRYTVAIEQGSRSYQEDRYYCYQYQDGSVFLSVMDGHGGGAGVAETVRDFFAERIPMLNTHNALEIAPEAAIKEFIGTLADMTDYEQFGSTLSLVYASKDRNEAYVAILGDSPVIVANDLICNFSPEHNVRTNLQEREAAISRGGEYSGGYITNSNGYGLQLSRSLGDSRMGKIVSREPEVYALGIQEEKSIIIVATDGAFDESHNKDNQEQLMKEAVNNVLKKKLGARGLMNRAKWRGLRDNATIIVWRYL